MTINKDLTADDLIALYNLKPLPVEGGLLRQTYCASEQIAGEALPSRYHQAKPLGTAVMALFTDQPDSFSALHQLPTDEIWHFYLGDPIEMLQLYPDGRSERVLLGQDVRNGHRVQYVAPRHIWMGARLLPGGRFALFGTTMAPGFTHHDYVGGERGELLKRYPHEAKLIILLTRIGEPLAMPKEAEAPN